MSKILVSLSAVALLGALAVTGPANAAPKSADGIRAGVQTTVPDEVSARRYYRYRYYRNYRYNRPYYYGYPYPYYQPYYYRPGPVFPFPFFFGG